VVVWEPGPVGYVEQTHQAPMHEPGFVNRVPVAGRVVEGSHRAGVLTNVRERAVQAPL
jgi:hypothetical protein